jgi:hypothetical protein
MPSDFTQGRPRMPTTLADLIERLSAGPTAPRPAFVSSPVAPTGRTSSRKVANKTTDAERRKSAARQALREIGKS